MSRGKWMAFACVALCGILAFSTVAFSEEAAKVCGKGGGGTAKMQKGGHRGMGMGVQAGAHPMMMLCKKLDLTEEQQAKMKELGTSHKEKMTATHEAVRGAQQALQEAVRTQAGEEAIRAAATNVGKAMGDQAVLKAGHMTEFRAILTEEQVQRMDEMRDQRKAAMEEGGFGKGKKARMMMKGKAEGCCGKCKAQAEEK